MPVVNEGKNVIADATYGGSTFNKFNAANTHVIVGDGTAAESVTDTELTFGTGGTGTQVKIVDSAGRSNNVVTYVATFSTSEAVFEWKEWGLLNAASSGELLNRKVESPSLGIKTGSQQWTFTVDITFGG